MIVVGAGLSGIGAACHLRANCPGKSFAVLEARQASGGTWDLFRYPGIRSDSDMFTLGYSFRPWKRGRGDRRRTVDPRIHPRDGPRPRGRGSDPLPASCRRRRMVDGRRPLERRGRADRGRRDRAPDLRLPVQLHRLLPLRPGLHAGVRGQRAVRGADRPPPALARRPRPRRQARGRDRQRRDRGDPDPVADRDRRSRDHAAALAELHAVAAVPGPDRRLPAPSPARPGGLRNRALEEHRRDDARLSAQPPPPRAGEAAAPPRPRGRAAGRLRLRHPLQAPVRTVGSAPLPGARRRSVPGHPRRRRVDRHRPDRRVHRRRDQARVRR